MPVHREGRRRARGPAGTRRHHHGLAKAQTPAGGLARPSVEGDIPVVLRRRGPASPCSTPIRRRSSVRCRGQRLSTDPIGPVGDVGRSPMSAWSSTAGATCTCSTRRNARTDARPATYASPRRWTRRSRRGFGDLSVHEVATDPTDLVWPTCRTTRAACGRSRSSTRDLVEHGELRRSRRLPRPEGNNFWGVEVVRPG